MTTGRPGRRCSGSPPPRRPARGGRRESHHDAGGGARAAANARRPPSAKRRRRRTAGAAGDRRRGRRIGRGATGQAGLAGSGRGSGDGANAAAPRGPRPPAAGDDRGRDRVRYRQGSYGQGGPDGWLSLPPSGDGLTNGRRRLTPGRRGRPGCDRTREINRLGGFKAPVCQRHAGALGSQGGEWLPSTQCAVAPRASGAAGARCASAVAGASDGTLGRKSMSITWCEVKRFMWIRAGL